MIRACLPWLDAELEAVEPLAVVCLGAAAAQALLGSAFRVTRERGKVLDFPGEHARWIMATYHPSAVLRSPDRARRHEMRAEVRHDLRKIARRLAES